MDEEEFRIPVHLRDLELSGHWISRQIECPSDVDGQKVLLDKIDTAISEKGIVDALSGDIFESWYVLVLGAGNEAMRVRVAWTLCEATLEASRSEAVRIGGEPDGTTARSERNAFCMTAYLCQAAILAAETHLENDVTSRKSRKNTHYSSDEESESSDDSLSDNQEQSESQTKSQKQYTRRSSLLAKKIMGGIIPKTWIAARSKIIRCFSAAILAIDINRLWHLGVCGEEFLTLWTKVGISVREKKLGTDLVVKAIKVAPDNTAFCLSTATLIVEDMIIKSAQASVHAAEICLAVVTKNDQTLCAAVFAEICRVVTEDETSAFVPQFLQALKPSLIISRIPELRQMLNSARSHAVRSAVVVAICNVLAQDAAARRRTTGQLFQKESQRDAALELVASRVRDVSYFSRAATLRELSRLAQAKAIPRAQVPARLLKAASDRLHDRAALVRKAALELCTSLLEHNPYHGDLSPNNTTIFIKDNTNLVQDEESPRRQAMAEYRQNAIEFIQILEDAAPSIDKLITSPTLGDTLGAAKFFAIALRFGLPQANDGIRSVLRLVWSPDHAVRIAVAPVLADALSALEPARLCELTSEWTQRHTELAQLEDFVHLVVNPHLAQDKKQQDVSSPLLDIKLIDSLWLVKTNQAAAVRLIAVFAKCGVKVNVSDRLEKLVSVAISPEMLAAIAVLARDAADTSPNLLKSLRDALTQQSLDDDDHYWYVAADAVTAATFAVDLAPENVLATWLHLLRAQAGSTCGLARLLHLAGHTALQMAAAAEDLGSKLAASRRAKHENEENAVAANGEEDNDLEAEARRASEADDEVRLAALVDQGLIGGDDNALAVLMPVAERLVDASLRSGDKPPPLLTRAAALCLVKMACVAQPCCERQLPRLVTLLANHNADTAARVSIAVGLGDLATRQPNTVEPWSDAIFSVLGDEDCVAIRANLLAVISRLVVNDILKLKGTGLAEVATRLVDPDLGVANSAKSLFISLNAKAHRQASPIYNLLPDVLSRLAPKHPDLFKPVVTYLLKFVDQPKHIIAIADKILRRLIVIKSQNDALVTIRNLTFALSKLPVSDKFISKLLDLFPNYKDILSTDDQVIKASFRDILNKAKRINASGQQSSDLANLVSTFAEKIKGSADPSSDDDNVDDDASMATTTVPATISKTPRPNKTPKATSTTRGVKRTSRRTAKMSSSLPTPAAPLFQNRTNFDAISPATATATFPED